MLLRQTNSITDFLLYQSGIDKMANSFGLFLLFPNVEIGISKSVRHAAVEGYRGIISRQAEEMVELRQRFESITIKLSDFCV